MKKYTGMSRNLLFIVFPLIIACSDKSQDPLDDQSVDILQKTFGNKIDLSQIPDYQGQAVPSYIQKRNTLF
jgi:hypothetical protein